jgi:hypothetical protein
MEGKLFYIFKDPLGARDVKVGITGSPAARLGNYQNSYSQNSHIACFDLVYYGPTNAVHGLEKAIKQNLSWDIERDGRGASEWISGYTVDDSRAVVEDLISGFRFKLKRIPKKFLPLTVNNLPELEKYLSENRKS